MAILTDLETVRKADAVNMARSFRYWAARPGTPTIRVATVYCMLSQATQLYERSPANARNQRSFNRFAEFVATEWQQPYQLLAFHEIYHSLSFISTEAQFRFYDDILNNGVYFMKPIVHSLSTDVVSKLEMALASLEQSLLAKDPMMPHHLRNSHQLLITYPESVALLDDQEIATLIGAAQVHTGIEVVKAAAPKTGGRKKITVDDL